MKIRAFVATGLALFAALYVLGHCTGCGSVMPAVAEGTYLGQQAKCVSDHKPDKVKIDACRDAVRARWADAGTQEAGQ